MTEITSRKNPLVQHLKQLGTDRAYREATGEFLCDGPKLYEEAVRAGMEITLVATSRREIAGQARNDGGQVCDDGRQACNGGGQVILVPEDVLSSISPMKTPQSLLFACKKPNPEPMQSPGRVLVLDGVQDPGNVGTLLRSARAFLADQVILVGPCADLYHPKTVRAAMGALFWTKAVQMSVDVIKDYVNKNELVLLGADAGEGQSSVSCADSSFGTGACGLAIVIGSEGQGISDEVLRLCHGTVRIPMEASSESLNAGIAGSILLWEMYRRREEG